MQSDCNVGNHNWILFRSSLENDDEETKQFLESGRIESLNHDSYEINFVETKSQVKYFSHRKLDFLNISKSSFFCNDRQGN